MQYHLHSPHRRSLEDVPEGVNERGTSRSAVSRRFVAATGKKLEEWMHRDLSALQVAAIMIDGIHVDGHVVIVALGGGRDPSRRLTIRRRPRISAITFHSIAGFRIVERQVSMLLTVDGRCSA